MTIDLDKILQPRVAKLDARLGEDPKILTIERGSG